MRLPVALPRSVFAVADAMPHSEPSIGIYARRRHARVLQHLRQTWVPEQTCQHMQCTGPGAGSGLDLAGPSSVLQALGVLASIVAIHEAGHFAAARVQGVHVTKFAIGFGPALLRYQVQHLRSRTKYLPASELLAMPVSATLRRPTLRL